jgi:Flp pilus assembly CpaE family ATPase
VVAASLSPADVPALGADVAVPYDPEQVCLALRGGMTASAPVARPDRQQGGRLIAVWGPVGAPGRTSVAVNVADGLSRLGADTLLADADTYGPSVAQHLGLLDDSSGLAAACRLASQDRLEVSALARAGVALPEGLRVLTGIPRTDRWEELRPAALDAVWECSRELVAQTVVDIGFCLERDELSWVEPGLPARNQAAVATLGAADVVLAVASADPVGLVRFIRDVPRVRALAPSAKLEVVVNRVPPGRDRSDELRALLGEHLRLEPTAFIPDDPAAFAAAVRSGRTLAEAATRSNARKRMLALAAQLGGTQLRRSRRRVA